MGFTEAHPINAIGKSATWDFFLEVHEKKNISGRSCITVENP
jgi:hypothetical protein